ncbi:MAG: hypothetical protein PUC47_05435 [Oscillospiraceae bacterium]|nr:hypothetical protein [Oscillospiraceae bacterium]
MKLLKAVSLTLTLAALAVLTALIFTDWNDAVFLPLALGPSAAANLLHLLFIRRDHTERRHHND